MTAPEDLLGLFLLGSDEVEKFVGKGPLNTDDNAMIEYGAPKDLITYATKDARLPFVEAIDGKPHHGVLELPTQLITRESTLGT